MMAALQPNPCGRHGPAAPRPDVRRAPCSAGSRASHVPRAEPEAAAAPPAEPAAAEALSEQYSDVMQQRMGANTLIYRHEAGMNYTRILDDLIVGSCLQTPDDLDRLATTEDVRTVLSLQENCDMEYFSLDLEPIRQRAAQRGDVRHVRQPIRDFDPFSLRVELPRAVALLAEKAAAQGGTAYVHCTAGLGRAPATALAYMWWFKGMHLEEAYDLLTGLRPCKPKVEAIRAAAADLLYGGEPSPVTIALGPRGTADRVQVAGLDVGWGQRIDLAPDHLNRLVVTRCLPPGKYQYKFIWPQGEVRGDKSSGEERWTYSANHPVLEDGGNLNNYVEVPFPNTDPEVIRARQRILSPDGPLTTDELERLQGMLLARNEQCKHPCV